MVPLIYNDGSRNNENLQWVETVWSNFLLRGKIIYDATGENANNNYGQPYPGMPQERWFIIDQQQRVVLAGFGYNPGLVIRTIYQLLNNYSTGKCRDFPDNTEVRLPGKIVTAPPSRVGGAFYIEEPDRSGGIRVKWNGFEIPEGSAVSVVGRLATLDTGERQVLPTSVTYGTAGSVDPLGISSWAAGSPLSLGLLVRAWGTVTGVGMDCFWIDDGGAISADDGHTGIRVACSGLTLPSGFGVGAYVSVSGVCSSIRSASGNVARQIIAREAADIQLLHAAP